MVLRSRLIIIAALIPLGLWQMADDAVCTPLSLSDPETYGSQGAVDALLNGRTGNESEINNVIQSARENLAPPSSEVFFEALADQPIAERLSLSNVRSLEELIETAGASAVANVRGAGGQQAAGPRQGGGTGASSQQSAQVATANTIEGIARSLINTQGSSGIAPEPTTEQASGTGFSVLASVMRIEVDSNVIQAIARVISPSIDLGGVVSFSVFGMGDFAFMVSADTDEINIIDVESGARTSMNYANRRPGYRSAISENPQRGAVQSGGTAQGRRLADLLESAKDWIFTYILHPFTLTTLAMLLVIWTLWRMRSREI
tara:strand:+ start:1511 stop:2464 length:954 start_codon:yes stop_codon:yes gene_type:complete